MYTPRPVRKQIAVRPFQRIKDDELVKDLDKFGIDQGCVDVDAMVEHYEPFLTEFQDKHAPLKNINVVERRLNEWITDNVLVLKAIRRCLWLESDLPACGPPARFPFI